LSTLVMASPSSMRNATVARRRRSCNRLPITGLGQY
jgi:hypothetical protein